VRRRALGIITVAIVGALGGAAIGVTALERQAAPDTCGTAAAAQMRTTLYFGMTRPTGAVSELEWQMFLRDEVTKRFPAGLTVWEAHGQWQSQKGTIDQERSKVLLLVHQDSQAARTAVHEVITSYRKAFDQESVLWETARVCVAS
jgi:hypothetical protein